MTCYEVIWKWRKSIFHPTSQWLFRVRATKLKPFGWPVQFSGCLSSSVPCFLEDSLLVLSLPLSINSKYNTNSSSSPVWSRHDVYLSFLSVMQWWFHLSAITFHLLHPVLRLFWSSVHHKVIGSKSASPQDCLYIWTKGVSTFLLYASVQMRSVPCCMYSGIYCICWME